jgi:hypothetical protein
MEAWVMARAFIGTDIISCGTGPVSNTDNNVTWAAWVLPGGSGSDIISTDTPPTGGSFRLLFESGNVFHVVVHGAIDLNSGFTLTSNVWAHVAATWEQSGGQFLYSSYVNGVAGSTVLNVTLPGNLTPLYLGNINGGGNPLLGALADVAIWKARLSVLELGALANGARPNTIRSANLVRWYPLGGIQSPEPDLSGNAFNGTLTGTNPAFGPPIAPFTPQWPQFFPSMMSTPFVLMPQIVT